jgi:hypothetical protein
MRVTTLAAALALFAPPATILTSTGCGLTCGGVLPHEGLRLVIDVPPAPDTYRVEIEAEGEVLEVQYEVTGSGQACSGCLASGDRLRISDGFAPDAEDLGLNIGLTDDAGGPRIATVRVFRGTVLAAEETFEPRYEVDEPNGRGCGEQVHASATLVVP